MYYKLNAIILKRQNFKEDDLLITAYSLESGKVILQAKGGKKIKSKLAGHLEPISLSKLEVTGAKYFDQLIGAQVKQGYYELKSNLVALAYTSYFFELIDGLTQEQHTDKRIFMLLKKTLSFFNARNNFKLNFGYKVARIAFSFKLLRLLGFDLSADPNLFLSSEINYFVEQPISVIITNKKIISKLSILNKLLNRKLEHYLEREIRAKDFLKQIL